MALETARTKLLGSLTVRKAYQWLRSVPVVGSALHRIALLALPMGSRSWVRIPCGLGEGLSMFVDLRYELGYVRGDHEPWLGDVLRRWLRPGDTFIDVGAHIGYFSLCAAKLVGPQGVVLAIEPDPENFARLQANVTRNDLVHIVRPLRAAVGSAGGEVLFHRASPSSSRVGGHVVRQVEGGGECMRVPLLRLDDWDSGIKPRTIKVDVEGAEVEVLQGASRIIDNASSCWIVELHSHNAREQVLAMLNKARYQVRFLQPKHPVYHDYHQEYVLAEPLDL